MPIQHAIWQVGQPASQVKQSRVGSEAHSRLPLQRWRERMRGTRLPQKLSASMRLRVANLNQSDPS